MVVKRTPVVEKKDKGLRYQQQIASVAAQTVPLLATNEMIVNKEEFQQTKAPMDQQ